MDDIDDVVTQLRKEEKNGLMTTSAIPFLKEKQYKTSLIKPNINNNNGFDSDTQNDRFYRTSQSINQGISQEKYRSIVENTSDFIAFITLSMKPEFTYVNPSFLKNLEYEKTDLIGKNSLDYIHPDDVNKVQSILKKYVYEKAKKSFFTGENSFVEKFQCRVKDKQGEWHDFQTTANIIHKEILLIAKDITSNKEDEKRFRLISDVTTDLIYEWDVKKDTLKWYGDIDKKLGYEPGEIQRTLQAWISLIHPEDQRKLKDSAEVHKKCTTPILEEYRIQKKDGSWCYWLDRGTPILDSSNQPVKWIGGCTDITQYKNVDNKLLEEKKFIDSMLKSLPGVFYCFDTTGHFLKWNKNFERVTEYSSEELAHLTPIDLFIDEDKEKIAEKIRTAFEKGYAEVDGTFLTKTGKKITFSFTGLKTEYQGECLLVGVGIDITNRKLMEEEIKKRISELETFHNIAVKRELQMIKLKKEINELCKKNGESPRYTVQDEHDITVE